MQSLHYSLHFGGIAKGRTSFNPHEESIRSLQTYLSFHFQRHSKNGAINSILILYGFTKLLRLNLPILNLSAPLNLCIRNNVPKIVCLRNLIEEGLITMCYQ